MEHGEAHSAIVAPRGVWWRPAGWQEKMWVTLAFVWCMVLFAMMPIWHLKGGQNPSGIRAKVSPADFYARVEKFVADYKVGEDGGMPVVAPPPGSEVYLHTVTVTFAPAEADSGGKTLALEERIRFAAGRVVLVTHDGGRLIAR